MSLFAVGKKDSKNEREIGLYFYNLKVFPRDTPRKRQHKGN